MVAVAGLWAYRGQQWYPATGNLTIRDFGAAKSIARRLYSHGFHTFYCGCPIKGKVIDLKSCAIPPKDEGARTRRVEWEHIVPASRFGKSFHSWTTGDIGCVDKAGHRFKGRRCAQRVSKVFRLIESDLYNLVPAVGSVNWHRGDKAMGMIGPGEPAVTECALKLSKNKVEPAPEMRGFIGRVYLYMDYAYPGRGIVTKEERTLYLSWHKEFPPNAEERERAKRIERVQGNRMIFMDGPSPVETVNLVTEN